MTAPGLHLLKGIFYGFLQRKGEEFRENLYLESQTTSLKWNHPIETSIGKWLALGFQVYIQKRSTFFFIRFTFEVTNPPWFASGNEISAYFTGIVLRHYKDPVMNQDLMEWHCIFSTVLWWAVFSKMGIIQSSPNKYIWYPKNHGISKLGELGDP